MDTTHASVGLLIGASMRVYQGRTLIPGMVAHCSVHPEYEGLQNTRTLSVVVHGMPNKSAPVT